MKRRLQVVVGEVGINAAATAMQDDQLDTEMLEQGDVVHQADEPIRVDHLVRNHDDKGFPAVCLNIRRRTSKPLHIVLCITHFHPYPLNSKRTI